MSATTENILEQLRQLESNLEFARNSGDVQSETHLIEQISVLKKQLMTANSALNESKQILKG